MKYINVRQLTRNLKEATLELPARVTNHGIPIFDIVPISSEKISKKIPDVVLEVGPEMEKIRDELYSRASIPTVTAHVEQGEPSTLTFKLCKAKFCNNSAEPGKDFCKEHK